MARRLSWLVAAVMIGGLVVGLAQTPPGEAGVVYNARLRCADLITGEYMPQCRSVERYQGAGWVQATIDGDTLVLHGAYGGLSAPVVALSSGVHLHRDPGEYHVDTLIRGLSNDGGTAGLFYGRVTLTPSYRTLLETGRLYVDIHTSPGGQGELKGVLMPVSASGLPVW